MEHFIDTTGQYKAVVNLPFHYPSGQTPPVVEFGKSMISFWMMPVIGEEAVGVIEDSDAYRLGPHRKCLASPSAY